MRTVGIRGKNGVLNQYDNKFVYTRCRVIAAMFTSVTKEVRKMTPAATAKSLQVGASMP